MWMQGARVRVVLEPNSWAGKKWNGKTGTVQQVIPAGGMFDFDRTRVDLDDGETVSFQEEELVSE